LEPQYAVFGQSAGVAAAIALAKDVAVQDVPVPELQAELLKAKQRIHVGKADS
jgi:hypothetical protein